MGFSPDYITAVRMEFPGSGLVIEVGKTFAL